MNTTKLALLINPVISTKITGRFKTLAVACAIAVMAGAAVAQSIAPHAPSDASADLKATILGIVSRFEGRSEAIAQADLPVEALPILEQMATDTEIPGYQRIGALEVVAIVPGAEASALLARIALTGTFDSAQRSAAARSLAVHDGSAALPTLAAMHEMGGEERRIAIEALAACPDRAAFAFLDRQVIALGSAGDPDALLALYRAREAWLAAALIRGDSVVRSSDVQLKHRLETSDNNATVTVETSLAPDAVSGNASLRITLLPIAMASLGGATADCEHLVSLARGTAPFTASFELARTVNSPGFAVLRTELLDADGSYQLLAETVLLR